MLVAASLSTNSRALWYLTRGFGLVALILLTVTMVIGLTQIVRFARPGWPRFVVSALHKNASLLAVVVLAVHIVTAVLDSYAPIRVVDVFIPFVGKYRPLWLGLGALSVDLLVALVVTSLLRDRLGFGAWRAVHWAAYACWPLAVVHGLGTGSDTKLGWVLFINLACITAVLAALWWRLASGWSITNAPRRGAAVLASIALPVAVAAWTVTGPLRPGWARRAGTPTALLGSPAAGAASSAASSSGTSGRARTNGALTVPFTGTFQGSQQQSGPDANGLVSVTISGTVTGAQSGRLTMVLTGQPSGGGVTLTSSQVTLGSTTIPSQYRGHITQLSGSTLVA
ncbi:MAG TPA: ferric reductase-like transmembrane domain-containing protein, partial [Acidimicrobiales bacterium]